MSKIIICPLAQLKDNRSDFNFLIVRSCSNPINNCPQLDALAPSKELFFWTLNQKKQGIAEEEWFPVYKRQYLQETKSPRFQYYLNKLLDVVKSGHSLTLCCYCTTKYCHRIILGEVLKEMGYDVEIK